jgi:hypothetical protein
MIPRFLERILESPLFYRVSQSILISSGNRRIDAFLASAIPKAG